MNTFKKGDKFKIIDIDACVNHSGGPKSINGMFKQGQYDTGAVLTINLIEENKEFVSFVDRVYGPLWYPIKAIVKVGNKPIIIIYE